MALASSVRIEIDGQEIKDFLDFSIDQKMKAVQEFQLRCRMDTFEEPDGFVMNESKKFIGSNISIAIETYKPGGDERTPGLFFKGIIHSVRAVNSDLSSEDQVVLLGYSPDVLLLDHAGCRSFENKSLKQVVDEVLKPYPRDILKTRVAPVYKEQIPYCVQYRENSLEFLQRLAARYGEWLYYNGSEFVFGTSKTNKEELILGKDLNTFDFSLKLKAPDFKYVSYDYMDAKRIESKTEKTSGKDQQNELGKYAYDQSGKQYSQSAVQDYPHLNVDPNKASKTQKSTLDLEASSISLGMSALEGMSENMKLVPGSNVLVKALKTESKGEVNYGDYIISSVKHQCDNLLNYENVFTAIPAEAKVPNYTDPNAFPASDPQSAIVKDNNDPEKLGRIRVQFFWQEGNAISPWIRLVTPYAGAERGFYFIPELEDEVLIGFEGGDAERPYVMGSLYHGKHKPAAGFPDQNNSFKGIITKSNLKIQFDDDKKITTIETPGGNTVVLSDDDKSILMQDQNQNKVELGSGGVSIDSVKDIIIKSKGKIVVDATSGMELTSKASLKVKGLSVEQTADTTMTVKGTASAELSASGQTTVKGAMVMIN